LRELDTVYALRRVSYKKSCRGGIFLMTKLAIDVHGKCVIAH
jgi:hypothetical protein